jgi:hypothetical protein
MKVVADLIENSGGRRFLITVGAGTFTTLLQWFGKLDASGTTFAMVIIATVGAYITNNTYQKVKSTTKEEADK